MIATTRECVSKAEGGYDAVCIPRRSRKPSRFDTICFHCQQCAEKYLKARLNEAGIRFGKTHDLEILLKPLLPIERLWTAMAPALKRLTDFSVAVRYQGSQTDSAAARQTYAICRQMRALARASLGLS